MATMIYAPEVIVRIRTSPKSKGKGQVIDVSEDLSSGSVTRIRNGVSTAQMTMLNQSRKYDNMFTPMDSIVVYFRRLRTVLKFTGYLDDVPKWAAEPGSISLTASCTLKRLQHFLWDPTSQAGSLLLNKVPEVPGLLMQDGGAAAKTIEVITKVANWGGDQIHIGRIPNEWMTRMAAIADEVIANAEAQREIQEMSSVAGTDPYMGGQPSGYPPSGATNSGTTNVDGIGPGTGSLPATSGRVSHFGGPNGGAYGNMGLTGESGVRPRDDWYAAMRWPYTDKGAVKGAKQWWVNRKILVTFPKTGKGVVLRAADWGPHISTGRVLDISPRALKDLGATTDDIVKISFAPPNASLGLVTRAAPQKKTTSSTTATPRVPSATTATPKVSAKGIDWGAAGDSANMTRVTAGGKTFTVHRAAAPLFKGFVDALQKELGYTSTESIGGFANRNIAGTSSTSNHAYGAAIDIDPGRNPIYYNPAGGPFALPTKGLVALARRFHLGWGGEWTKKKDYMHFEVIGAPASSTYSGTPPSDPGTSPAAASVMWKVPVRGKYTITARFGQKGKYWANGHTGTDFSQPSGSPVYSVGVGVVSQTSYNSDYGNNVTVDHGGGHFTFYAHFSKTTVSAGAKVTENTKLGEIGATGNVTGPHLHIEYRRGADTYSAALASGGIEKYLEGGVPAPSGAATSEGGVTTTDPYSPDDYTTPDVSQEDIGERIFNSYLVNLSQTSEEGTRLGGSKALMNDEPVFQIVETLMSIGMRDFCSAPNGDFIGWFPDYFGHYQMAGKMIVTPLEIDGVSGPPTIGWSDRALKTHQYVTGASSNVSQDAGMVWRKATTAGVVSVEMPEVMSALLNISTDEAKEMGEYYLHRYGPRVDSVAMNNVSGARQEFFFACHLFQRNWANQYQARVGLMFMPELFPGMLLCIPEYGIQGYVNETTDSFSLEGGGASFRTTVSCAPWSSMGKNSKAAAQGLPVGAPL